jgi:hypothetical protein
MAEDLLQMTYSTKHYPRLTNYINHNISAEVSTFLKRVSFFHSFVTEMKRDWLCS